MKYPSLTPPYASSPHDSPPEHFARGEQALWMAVINQALIDAASNSGKDEAQRHRLAALDWLAVSDDEDFLTVCDLAGLDPNYVFCRALQALHRGCQWRLPAGQGWRARARAATHQRECLEVV